MHPVFYPAMRLIAAITNSNPASVTTTFAHQYKDLIVVRLDIPYACGMQQANGLTGTITVTSDTTFLIDINTTNFDVFVAPDPDTTPPYINICAMVVPIGEDNSTLINAVQNTLPFGPI
jgi:hypothetical protein